MSWVAVGMIGASVIGGIASNRAASKQAKAERKSVQAQNELIGPFTQAGTAGLEGVQSFVDQGADFSQTQAFKDIINTQKARGANLSGGTLTGLTDYYARNFRPQRMNELSFLPTVGANTAVGQATNIGNSFSNIGAAQAAGTLGVGQAAIGGLNALQFMNTSNPSQSISNTPLTNSGFAPGSTFANTYGAGLYGTGP